MCLQQQQQQKYRCVEGNTTWKFRTLQPQRTSCPRKIAVARGSDDPTWESYIHLSITPHSKIQNSTLTTKNSTKKNERRTSPPGDQTHQQHKMQPVNMLNAQPLNHNSIMSRDAKNADNQQGRHLGVHGGSAGFAQRLAAFLRLQNRGTLARCITGPAH